MTKVVQANTPGGRKPGLLPHPARTRRLIRWCRTHGVGLIGMQELSSPSVAVWRLRWAWLLVLASPNNVGVWGLGRIRNGMAFRRGVWAKQGKRREIRLPWGERGLRIPVVPMHHAVLGDVLVYVIHLPAGPGNEATRAAMVRTLAADAETQTLPVIWLGDFNDDELPAMLRARDAGWRTFGRGVDWVAVLGLTIAHGELVDDLHGISLDHRYLIAADIQPTH